VEAGARVVRSIVGPRAAVGDGASVVGCVLGEGATVAAAESIEGVRVQAFSSVDP
jgi:NDP-sugar pyrophosphorylase family protein